VGLPDQNSKSELATPSGAVKVHAGRRVYVALLRAYDRKP
jgi:hypothetical protein